MFDNSKLRGKIIEKCKTRRQFAKAMGWSDSTATRKLNSDSDMTQSEIWKACKILDISRDDVATYFFCEPSSEIQTNC